MNSLALTIASGFATVAYYLALLVDEPGFLAILPMVIAIVAMFMDARLLTEEADELDDVEGVAP